MRTIFFFSLLCLFIISCGRSHRSAKKAGQAKQNSNSARTDGNIAGQSNAPIRQKITGTWVMTGNDASSTSFKIQRDSIYYPDLSRNFSYRLEEDSIKINFVDYETSFQVSMNGRDTLKFMGEGGEQIYYRVKK
jgi:Tfp pilus assembly protein PilX